MARSVRSASCADERRLASALPENDPRRPVLQRLAAIQAAKGFQVIGGVGYLGSHYFATFATMYLLTTTPS